MEKKKPPDQTETNDDDYKALQGCFLKKGKGRRPTAPHFPSATKKLLLQLYFIREEKQSSFAELKSWLDMLVPNNHATEMQVYQQIMAILKMSHNNDTDKLQSLLAEEFKPDCLHPTLAALGLSRLHLTGNLPYNTAATSEVTNDVAIRLEQFRAKLKLPHSFVAKWLRKLSVSCESSSDAQIKNKITGIVKAYARLSKDKDLEKQKMFLMESFRTGNKEKLERSCSKCEEKARLIQIETNEKRELKEQLEFEKQKNAIVLELQTEKSEMLDCISNLKGQIRDLKSTVKSLKEELSVVRKENDKMSHKLDNIRSSKLYKDNYEKKRKIEEVMTKNDLLAEDMKIKTEDCKALKQEIGSIKKKIKSEQSMKSKLRNSYNEQQAINSELSQMLMSDKEENKIDLREGGSSHRYSNNIRKTYYALQGEANVSAAHCSKVVSTVARCLFKSDISEKDLPTQSTALNFVNEANVIAQEHIVEELRNSAHFTYACDGTSRDKAHYLERHIHLSNGKSLSLGYSQIASDDSETLLEKCISCFQDLCDVHCLDSSENKEVMFKELIKKMKCLLTDRASVCKAFDLKMAQYKDELLGGEDASTYFLFCNAHFLLALSASAESAVVDIEKMLGCNLGRDCDPKFAGWKKKDETAAVRLIRLVSSIVGPRCDERNGCRVEWLAFCDLRGIKSSFTSYRSNRFNNLFQNATALIKHKCDLELFLTE